MATQQVQAEVSMTQPEAPVTALVLKKRVSDLDSQIKQFANLATAEEYETVANFGRAASRIIREAEEFYEPEVKRLHSLWKDKTTERASITGPAEQIKNLAARLCGEWQQQQERERLEAERRLEEEQRRLAETAVIEEAAALEKDGRVEEAQALIEAPVAVAPVAVATNVPKVAGVSRPRDNWTAEVTNFQLLIKAVAEGKVPTMAVQANMTFLNQQARSMKGQLSYPGVRVRNDPKAAFRS